MASRRKVVAVVENHPEVRSAIGGLLFASGYDTELYESAEAFLSTAAASGAQCLVIDVRLGDITGIELSRQLASMGVQLPTIFVSSVKDPYAEQQISALGHAVFLDKFVLAERLASEIAKLLVPC